MLDSIWFILLFGGMVTSLLRGESAAVTMALLTESEAAVTLTLTLIGSMTFWLGILSIAEAAGLVTIFPTIPVSDPAAGSVLLNLSANMLGLGNAATPLGLRAMQQLQQLNPNPDEATPAMCTFLALNTCCITFVPTSIIAARMAAGSTNPAATVVVTFLSTVVATTTAIIGDRICQCLWGRD